MTGMKPSDERGKSAAQRNREHASRLKDNKQTLQDKRAAEKAGKK
jgi:hypothetical protein